ncbi:MAG TPA: diacylglycerol kinase family lipid kinase [Lachnospiraceae bacterium]|nr:diacylglycerol kinase family lipid kinase [Lachnospiraceae bacterium]
MVHQILLIYNPKAGKGIFLTKLADVIDMFVKGGYTVEVYPTQAPGDAVKKISALPSYIDMIVAAGGDGTLDEVVTGLMQSGRDVPIAYIPVGSTNDFAASLGLSTNIIEAVGDILGGEPRGVDVGMFNGDNFVYVAAFGAFTDVAYETNQDMKNIFGHIAYIMEGARRLGDIKSYMMTVTVNRRVIHQDYIFGMITNSTSVGGIRNITGQEVKLDDGLFEVTLIHNPKNIIEFQEIIGSLLMGNADTDLVDSFKTDHIIIESTQKVPWTLDGEYGGEHATVAVTNRKMGMRIVLDGKQAAIL